MSLSVPGQYGAAGTVRFGILWEVLIGSVSRVELFGGWLMERGGARPDDPFALSVASAMAESRDEILDRLLDAAAGQPAWFQVLQTHVHETEQDITGHVVDKYGFPYQEAAVCIPCRLEHGASLFAVGEVLRLWRDESGPQIERCPA